MIVKIERLVLKMQRKLLNFNVVFFISSSNNEAIVFRFNCLQGLYAFVISFLQKKNKIKNKKIK